MLPVYMPFTFLPEPTARLLKKVVGPMAVYQPIGSDVPRALAELARQELLTIRAPMTDDDDRLKSALAEFTEWARLNPGRTTAGAGFVGSRQGAVPHFDENTINHIRAEIRRHGDVPASGDVDSQAAAFSARLFLAIAQANDQATANLDDDLQRFQVMEQGFVASLGVDDAADFSQHGVGTGLWREDPGARQTGQRIRAWATLAAADPQPPGLLVTTSPAVVDTLLEMDAERLGLETVAVVVCPLPGDDQPPLLNEILADLAGRPDLSAEALAPFLRLREWQGDGVAVRLTLIAARGRSAGGVIASLAATAPSQASPQSASQDDLKALLLLIESGVKNG